LLTYFLDNPIVLDDNEIVDTYEVVATNARKFSFEIANLVDLYNSFSISLDVLTKLDIDDRKNV
jgi:hypothetical protein